MAAYFDQGFAPSFATIFLPQNFLSLSLVEYVEDPSFVKHLISWRILKRRSTTTLSNTVIDRTARFHYPTLTPFPREITIPIRGEGSIFTLIELEANQRSLIFELYSRSNIVCSTVLIVLFHVY